ncbi:Na+/H+ antiporter NhaA [Ornithobacterium rhinotracheale]|uniref:Na+/H+ antiporter NhaA n=1 Tax=Ornithobacterium rhinotracheale TaxID=28251 RepID=UPI004035D74B
MNNIQQPKKELVDIYIKDPILGFINNSTASGIVLFISALLALIIANTGLSHWYHDLWHIHFKIGFDDFMINKDLHHWINDGLMAIFFFVVGLELKREVIAGELSNPKNAILPLCGAVGGMLVPAAIYMLFNSSGEPAQGWGIPMATDIAFALGILYMLGKNVPTSLKIFLTALAIADDIGAVLVIAFFYTSNIDFVSLATGAAFLAVLITANLIGVRNTLFYAIVGIVGLWTAFLMSGVHATIAAVIAAFTIPTTAKMPENLFTNNIQKLLHKFNALDPNGQPTLTEDQLHVVSKMSEMSKSALPPLQRLEHSMHPLVSFVVMPIFAFANAGVTIEGEFLELLLSPVTLGVILGLLIGKVTGIFGITFLLIKTKLAKLPDGMNLLHLLGASVLAAIGFTMSLFISGLAFNDPIYDMEAKIGILMASAIAGVLGFLIIKKANQKTKKA